MVVRSPERKLTELYEADETAWLDEMARLAAAGDAGRLDLPHLSEYLTDMAKRDRREVLSRLTVLLAHLLKWDAQPDKRVKSWETTIRIQRRELEQLLQSGALRTFAEAQIGKAYEWAVEDAMSETELPREAFPAECPYTLAAALGEE
ncbi:MAG: DUF29 domain-containing protein [Gemmataceae bacterium]